MCGLLLIYSKKKKLLRSSCKKAFKLIYNRGPDKQFYNFFLKDKLFIGNSVLHINGIIKEENELYNYKNIFLAYNGEIYNHKELDTKYLKSKQLNDTETLLNLNINQDRYQVLRKLNGMFAYIIYDKKKREIYFATDPQGEKKILKYENSEFFILSSTIKPILNFLKKDLFLNKPKIENYFYTRHYMQLKNTILKDVNYIEGGTIYSKKLLQEKITKRKVINPINWINKSDYIKNQNKSPLELSMILEEKITKTLNIMEPEINYGTIMSGGIDSSLISSILDKNKFHKLHFCLTFKNKDKPANNVKQNKFRKYVNYKKLKIFSINEKKYYKNLIYTYNKFCSPLSTHDLPSRLFTYKYFKKKKIKVIFGGDGADEIFGGYQKYNNVFKKKKLKLGIISPYSSNQSKNSKEFIVSENLFKRAYKKYRSFLIKKEAIIQSNLFVDYFVQSVGVHNVSNDILCGENSIEMRSLFMNPNIIKFALNQPISSKINLKEKNKHLILKPILKRIFQRRLDKNLITKKQGFSGFPTNIWKSLRTDQKNEIIRYVTIKFKIKLKKLDVNLKWKILNIYFFSKYNKNIINL